MTEYAQKTHDILERTATHKLDFVFSDSSKKPAHTLQRLGDRCVCGRKGVKVTRSVMLYPVFGWSIAADCTSCDRKERDRLLQAECRQLVERIEQNHKPA